LHYFPALGFEQQEARSIQENIAPQEWEMNGTYWLYSPIYLVCEESQLNPYNIKKNYFGRLKSERSDREIRIMGNTT